MPGRKQPGLHQHTSSIHLSLLLRREIELSSLTPLHQPQWLAYYQMSCTEEEWAMHHCTYHCLHTHTLVRLCTQTHTSRITKGITPLFVSVRYNGLVGHTWMWIQAGAHVRIQRYRQCLCCCCCSNTKPVCCHSYISCIDMIKWHSNVKSQRQFSSHGQSVASVENLLKS